MSIRVLHVGLGPIGVAVAAQVTARAGFRSVAAVDLDPRKVGRDLGELIGSGARLRVPVMSNLAEAIRASRPDVAVLCTGSSLRAVMPQFEDVLECRVPIVTTTEEAACVVPSQRRLGRRLDEAARRAKVAVLGTGVNPGFAMDALPIALTAVCERVTRVEVTRVQDSAIRRLPFQQKTGAGLTVAEFRRRVRDRQVGHVGFAQSIQMIADALGWKLDRVTDVVQPKVATARVGSDHLQVETGRVAGLAQEGAGYVGRDRRIVLRLEAYLGAPESYDAVLVEGTPRLYSRIEGGIHGDIATASMVVNALPAAIASPPGFKTMREMPLPSFYGGR